MKDRYNPRIKIDEKISESIRDLVDNSNKERIMNKEKLQEIKRLYKIISNEACEFSWGKRDKHYQDELMEIDNTLRDLELLLEDILWRVEEKEKKNG